MRGITVLTDVSSHFTRCDPAQEVKREAIDSSYSLLERAWPPDKETEIVRSVAVEQYEGCCQLPMRGITVLLILV